MDLTEVKRVDLSGVPSGMYRGSWSGHVVEWQTCAGRYQGTSEVGVRGETDVMVKCREGICTFEEIDEP